MIFIFIVNSLINKVCLKYEIQPKMAKYLLRLTDFEMVIVCDDSSSMMTPINDTDRTRWDELCSIVRIVVEIGMIFNSNGIHIYFPNRPSVHQVNNSATIDQILAKLPNGDTPLAPVLNRVFESDLAQHGRDKKLLVLIATDGESKENIHELEYVMREKR